MNSSEIGSTNVLPVVDLPVFFKDKKIFMKFLIDTGSQRSYLSNKMLAGLNYPVIDNKVELLVNTFIDSGKKTFAESGFSISFEDGGKDLVIPFYVDEKF